MSVAVLAFVVAFLAYGAHAFVDSAGWGLPRWRPAPRLRCHHYGCGASFVLIDPPLGTPTALLLKLHEEAAHQGEEARQLWPKVLPPRNRDFTTKAARDEARRQPEDRDHLLVNGVRVTVLKGGRNGSSSRNR